MRQNNIEGSEKAAEGFVAAKLSGVFHKQICTVKLHTYIIIHHHIGSGKCGSLY